MDEKQFFALHRKRVYIPDHPYSIKSGVILEYRLKVEKAIGRYLKPTEVVHHHYNADGSATLVLCPNIVYHKLLHIRELALRMCGNTNWRKCTYCKQYDDLKNMSNNTCGTYHKECKNNYQRKRRIKNKMEGPSNDTFL